jgi:hypothetical protein
VVLQSANHRRLLQTRRACCMTCAQQIVGRERRERVSHHDSSGNA